VTAAEAATDAATHAGAVAEGVDPSAAVLTAAALEVECTVLGRDLVARKVLTRDAVAALEPGGAENPGDRATARAWLDCYRRLQRAHARAERGGGGEQQAGRLAATLEALRPQVDRVSVAAQRSAPEVLELAPRFDRGGVLPRCTVRVYPKSHNALWFLACQDYRVRWISARIHAVTTDGGAVFAEDDTLLERLHAELAYRYQLLALGATHPGCGLPFDPLDPPSRGEIPALVRAISSDDFVRIHGAFVRVNALRLQALHLLSAMEAEVQAIEDDEPPPEATEGRGDRSAPAVPSWNQVFAVRAIEEGVDGERLFEDRALPALVASAVDASRARREAYRTAKRRAEAEARRERDRAENVREAQTAARAASPMGAGGR
jgi:hypothetical protein